MTWAPPGGDALVPESRPFGGLTEPWCGSGIQGFTTIEFPEEFRVVVGRDHARRSRP